MGARFLLLVTTATVALGAGSAVSAAETGTQDVGEPAAAGGADVDAAEIIVTANRREQRLQDVPIAVTALSSDALDQLNVRSTQDLMSVVPGLQVSTQSAGDGGGSATFFLRGMGQQRSGNGSEPAVGVYVDDFYYPTLSGALFKIVDLDQVEVLRGPQGTLFGRNTIGGAIRYTTRGARLGTFEGHVSGTIGNHDRYDISGAINVPIGDFAAIRVSGGHLQQDGFVRRQNDGGLSGKTETNLVRIQARIEPTSTTYLDIAGQWSRDKLDGFAYRLPGPVQPKPGTIPFIYNLVIAPLAGLPLYNDASVRSRCYYCQPGTDSPEFSYTTNKNLLATAGWEISDSLAIKSLTGWQDIANKQSFDLDCSPLPLAGGIVRPSRTYAFSQELQLNGKLWEDRLNFVAGAFYYNQRQPLRYALAPLILLGAPAAPVPPEDRTVKSYAGFIDGSLKLTDSLTLLGGFRYSED
jgi:iron complex outermembrane receptor protein